MIARVMIEGAGRRVLQSENRSGSPGELGFPLPGGLIRKRRANVVELGDGDPRNDRFRAGFLLRPASAVFGEDDQCGASDVGQRRCPKAFGDLGQRCSGE